MLINDRLLVYPTTRLRQCEAGGSTLTSEQQQDVRDEAKAKVEEHDFDCRHCAPNRCQRAVKGAGHQVVGMAGVSLIMRYACGPAHRTCYDGVIRFTGAQDVQGIGSQKPQRDGPHQPGGPRRSPARTGPC